MFISRLERMLYSLIPNFILARLLPYFPKFRFFKETRQNQSAVSFNLWYQQKVRRTSSDAYWPVHPSSRVVDYQNIHIGIDVSPGTSPGCYIQGMGKVVIGDYTQIAPNVGIISANHSLYDNSKYEKKEVNIGAYCWLGMGAIILPGVSLGEFTIVAAGAIVTKSFEDGYQVLAGNPARVIKNLEKEKCIRYTSPSEYHGYIAKEDFTTFSQKHLQTPTITTS
jgi:acetyltransferase-like isoleucine patch superfamily enzyme